MTALQNRGDKTLHECRIKLVYVTGAAGASRLSKWYWGAMPQGSTRWCTTMKKVQEFCEFKYADGLHAY
jgi:hypothetical protein